VRKRYAASYGPSDRANCLLAENHWSPIANNSYPRADKHPVSRILLLLAYSALLPISAHVCDPAGNLFLLSNYDGGIVTINVDQDIPNLGIGRADEQRFRRAREQRINHLDSYAWDGNSRLCASELASSARAFKADHCCGCVPGPITYPRSHAEGYA
jgi:hypothetical protein